MTAQDPSTDLENVNAAYRAMREERDRAVAEVERLRALNDERREIQARTSAEVKRLREALREIAGHVEDGGEYPDSYELGCREMARIASGALADTAKEDGR